MIIRTNDKVHSGKYIVEVLKSKDKELNVVEVDKIYYPYCIVIYRVKMNNPNSSLNRRVLCVIDMVTGRGSIGDGEPELAEIEVDDVQVVDVGLTPEQIVDKAHDYVFKEVMSKLRVLNVPELTLESAEYFHKLFYVVHCKDKAGKDYFLLGDSIEAKFTELAS